MLILDESFRPSKKLGQNFLVNQKIVAHIAHAGIGNKIETGIILEIGPGKGILTQALLERAQKRPIIAIEKDRRLFTYLSERFKHEIETHQLILVHNDALLYTPPDEPYTIVANIPYSVTSPLIDHFIRDAALTCIKPRMPKRAVFLVQKEVAEKICARPPDMNVLALHVQTFGSVRYLFTVGAGNFSPRPRVDSALIEINCEESPFLNWCAFFAERTSLQVRSFLENYFEIIHRGFSQKRKMLSSTIGRTVCEKAGIEATRRPQTLSIEEWLRLANS